MPMLALAACASAPAAPAVTTASATTIEQAKLVDVGAHVPSIDLDIRYASTHNFTAVVVDGYQAPKCLLLRPVTEALAKVQARLASEGLRLRVFDCYRPVRAVQAFMRWIDSPGDNPRSKAEFYPTLEKSALRGGYIAATSGHSRGATLDLTLMQCANDQCRELDMGTPFDYFGEPANTDSPNVTAAQRHNRQRLRDAMQAQGFANYPMEWWHYTFKPEPTPTTQYDVPVQ